MRSLTIASPAKVNLNLRVTGRCPNGYHALHTVFHRISLADSLRLSKVSSGFFLRTNVKTIPTDENNLVTKAYRMLQSAVPGLGGVRVYLTKRIPSGAGLGGGSSNAAFFLLGMNRLYDLKLSRQKLIRIGKRLGADVPFFLYDTNQAIAVGRGDIIRPKPVSRDWYFLLVIDNKELKTKDVFGRFTLPRRPGFLTKAGRTARMLCTFLDRGNPSALIPLLHNDLEKPAFELRPSIRSKIERLNRAGLTCVRMSGSGPTVFALLPRQKDLKQHLLAARQLFPAARVEGAKTL